MCIQVSPDSSISNLRSNLMPCNICDYYERNYIYNNEQMKILKWNGILGQK